MSLRSLTTLLVLGSSLSLGCFGSDSGDEDDDDSDDGGNEVVDSDGDGLTDDEEAELGLDPNSADSDLDGFEDLTEVEAGTDGALCWSVPEGWPDCTGMAEADGVEATGWGIGDVVKSWPAVDQFEEDFEFHQLYGMIVLIDFSAGWCGPCRTAAETAQEEYEEFAPEGVMFVHLVVDDNSYDGAVTDEDFKADWAEQYGLTFPVVTDDSKNGYAEAYYEWYQEGFIDGIPAYVLVDRDMTVADSWNGASSSKIKNKIGALLEAEGE